MSVSKFVVPAIVAAVGACVSAHAQSSVNLYGVIDVGFGSYQVAGSKGSADNTRTTKVEGGQMITSFFGLRGTEDLGSGTKAGFVLESFFRPDIGASGRSNADVMWARSANVWLQNSLGKVTLGRQGSLLFGNTLSYNALGSSFGLSPAIRLTFGKFGNDLSDSGWSNAVSYQTPTLAGFTGTAQVQFGEDAAKGERTSYAVGGTYSAGALSIGGAWQSAQSADAPKGNFNAGEMQNFGMLGVSYDAGFAKLFGQYGEFANKGFTGAKRIDTKLYQFGAAVPVTKAGKILASYGQSKETAVGGATFADVKHSILTVAYDHYLSKRTDVYAAFMLDDEDQAGYKKGTTYTVGVRHAF